MRPGTDAALALAITGVLLDRGPYDIEFVRRFTNAPLLVRADTGRLLRSDDVPGAEPGRYVAWDTTVAAPATYDAATRSYDGDEVSCARRRRWLREHAAEAGDVDLQAVTRISTIVTTDADLVLGAPIPKGLGYFQGLPEMGGRAAAFGCKGSGGSVAFADPELGLSFAFAHNRLTGPPDDNAAQIADRVRDALVAAATPNNNNPDRALAACPAQITESQCSSRTERHAARGDDACAWELRARSADAVWVPDWVYELVGAFVAFMDRVTLVDADIRCRARSATAQDQRTSTQPVWSRNGARSRRPSGVSRRRRTQRMDRPASAAGGRRWPMRCGRRRAGSERLKGGRSRIAR